MIPWPVDRTVMGLFLRGLVTGRRALALGIIAILPVLAAIAGTTGDVEPELFWARLVQRLLIPVTTAFVAIVIGAGALADEREEGTILYLASTPLRRITIVGSAITAAVAASLMIVLPATIVAGVISLRGDLSAATLGWPVVAVLVACIAYCALGALLAMVLRHPVVAGVLYILLWEGTFATWTDTAEYFSIGAYARAIAVEGVSRVTAPDIAAPTALIILILGTAAGAACAAWRLARAELP